MQENKAKYTENCDGGLLMLAVCVQDASGNK